MTGNVNIPIWALVCVGIVVTLFLGWIVARLLRSRPRQMHSAGPSQRSRPSGGTRRTRNVARAAERVDALVTSSVSTVDDAIEALVAMNDLAAVDKALNARLETANANERGRLLKAYQRLDLIKWHRKRLKEEVDWADRADSAYALGRLRMASAIPDLVSVLEDDQVDSERVRMAVVQALSEMRGTEALNFLIDALGQTAEDTPPELIETIVDHGESAVPVLLSALSTREQSSHREQIVRVLGEIGSEIALPGLVTALHDRAESVRCTAAKALGQLGRVQTVVPLVTCALRDPSPILRRRAAEALHGVTEEQFLPVLLTGMKDDDYLTRVRTIEAMEVVRPTDVSALAEALDDPSPEVRRRAAETLVNVAPMEELMDALGGGEELAQQAWRILLEVGQSGQVEALLPYLEQDTFQSRGKLAQLLGEMGDRRAVAGLQRMLTDDVVGVRISAIEALARLRPPHWVDVLRPTLSARDAREQTAVAQAFRELGLPEHELEQMELAKLFYSVGPPLRAAIVELTGGLESPEVVQILKEALVDVDDDVRLEATKAVADQGWEPWFDALQSRLDDPSTAVRAAAVRGLGRIGTTSALTSLFRHTDTPDPELREALSDALAGYGPKVLAALAKRSTTPEHTLAMVWALGKTRHPDAVSQLVNLASHEDDDVRAAVAGALGKHADDERAAGALVDLLGDLNERVRAASANALGRIPSGKDLLTDLVKALEDPDPFVRNRVALAVGRLGGELAVESLIWALHRAKESYERGFLLIGLVLEGSHKSLSTAVPHLENETTKAQVKDLLEKEDDTIRIRFRRSIRLEVGQPAEVDPGTGLTAGDLVSNYVMTLLNSQYISARASSVTALRSLGVEPFKWLVFDAARTDPAPEVRLAALQALGDLKDDTDVDALCVEALGDRDPQVQIEAAKVLAPAKKAVHFEALLRCFASGSPVIDRAIVDALVATRPQDLPLLLRVISRFDDESVLRGTATALRAIGNERATSTVASWLSSPSEALRAEATSTLGQFDSSEAQAALLGRLSDQSPLVRQTALDAIPNLFDEAALDAVKLMVNDPIVSVRLALARLAARGPYPNGVDITERLCWDDDRDVRLAALVGLLFARNREALERFVVTVRRQPERIKRGVRQVGSVRLAAARLEAVITKARDSGLRATAIKALAELGERPVEHLINALNSSDKREVLAAIEVLHTVEDPRVEQALRPFLEHADPDIASAVRKRHEDKFNPPITPAMGWEVIKRQQTNSPDE